MEKTKHWPKDCIWPEPSCNYEHWTYEEVLGLKVDEETEDLLEIIEYFDDLVDQGILNEKYTLIENDEIDEDWKPSIGEDYWIDNRFDLDFLEDDLSEHMNLLKLPVKDFSKDPVCVIQRLIDYEFVNENLIRQAFTRRSFANEYSIGDSEKLELLGDSVLNFIVTKIMMNHLADNDVYTPAGPFSSKYSEGELSRIRTSFINKDYLSSRLEELKLDRYILYGNDEQPSSSAKEDTLEALIGAVAIDCNWDMGILEEVTDRLLCVQLTDPDRFLKKTHYELLNSWHQKHFGCIPIYETELISNHKKHKEYSCTITFHVPDSDSWHLKTMDAKDSTRNGAREKAAMYAYAFLVDHGLWINLKDAHIIPSLDLSINQLQELNQKGYTEKPVYEFKEENNQWHCSCICNGVNGYGWGPSKTAAKKKAAYMVLVRLLGSSGMCEEEWKEIMWKNVLE